MRQRVTWNGIAWTVILLIGMAFDPEKNKAAQAVVIVASGVVGGTLLLILGYVSFQWITGRVRKTSASLPVRRVSEQRSLEPSTRERN